MLPDASTEQDPGTLAGKLSRRAPREHSEQRGCKPCLPAGREGMAYVFAVRVQGWFNITRVAVQTFKVTGKLSRYCYFLNSTGAVSRLPRASEASDGGPDLSCLTLLSGKQKQIAKTMTS